MDKILIKEVYMPIIYIAIGTIIYQVLKQIIKKIFNIDKRVLNNKNLDKKKIKTLEQLIINILRILVITFIILSIMTVFGIDVKTFVAGIGVIGVVVGLALQDILKDFIVGFSLIIENYFSVGDTIEINGFKGKVTYLGLRTTKLQQYAGPILIISNRNITEVINYTNTYSQAIVDVNVAYESDVDKVEIILKDLATNLTTKLDYIEGEVEVLGIDKLELSSITFRIMVFTKPLKHLITERIIRKEVIKTLRQHHIKIPYQQIEVHNGK